MRQRSKMLLLALAATSALSTGCAPSEEETEGDEAALTTKFRTIWADLKNEEEGRDAADKWGKIAGDVLSDQAQDAVSSNRLGFKWKVEAAGAKAKDSSLPGLDVHDLNDLSTGLLQKFGDTDLPAQVAKIRYDQVRKDGSYYLDASSTVTVNGGFTWGANGPDVVDGKPMIWFGFDANTSLESRVVVNAPNDQIKQEADAWLKNVLSQRDYFLHKSADKVLEMKPGEMWGLRGAGTLGAHVGVGVPIVIAAPLNLIISAGGNASMSGMLDVQVVKLEGKQVVVDLGIEEGKLKGWTVGAGTSYGMPRSCKDTTDEGASKQHSACLPQVGGFDLSDSVPKLTKKIVNRFLGTNVQTGAKHSNSRLSVLRLRFDFGAKDGDSKAVKAAFARAIRFDAREAQSLYYQQIDNPKRAVTVEADLFRSASSSVRYTNWNAFGMSIYAKTDGKTSGALGLRTPTDTKIASFDVRNRRSGWGSTRHGFDRMAFAAQTSSGAEANLILNLATSTEKDDKGLVVNNADAALIALAGVKASDSLDEFGNTLEGNLRPCGADLACASKFLGSDFAKTLDGKIDPLGLSKLAAGYGDIAKHTAKMRLIAQGSFTEGQAVGPEVDFTYGTRLDAAGLDELMKMGRVDEFKARLIDHLTATTSIGRGDIGPGKSITKAQLRARIKGDGVSNPILNDPKWPQYKDLIEELGGIYDDAAKEYRDLKQMNDDARTAMKQYENRYVPVFVGVSIEALKNADEALGKNQDLVESIAFASIAHKRAVAATNLFDKLYKASSGEIHRSTHLWAEQLIGFSLASMVPLDKRETVVQLRVNGTIADRYKAAGLDAWAPCAVDENKNFDRTRCDETAQVRPQTAGKVTKIAIGPLDLEAVAKEAKKK